MDFERPLQLRTLDYRYVSCCTVSRDCECQGCLITTEADHAAQKINANTNSSISGESIFEHIAHEIPQLKSRVSQKPGGAEAEPEAARKKSKKK